MLSRYFGSKKSSKDVKKKWEKEVTFIVEGGKEGTSEGVTLKVQKKLLMEHSGYFRDMTEQEMKKCKKMKLEDMTVIALQNIVAFMQKSTCRFTNHTEALETLQAAHQYQILELLDTCTNHLITILDPSNVCDVYDVATSLSLSYLEYSCLKFLDKNGDEVLKSRTFLTLKKAVVLDIIKRNTINISSEVIVFQAVLSWGLNDSLKRGLDPDNTDMFLPVVRHLLNHVRFSNMAPDELKDPEVDKYVRLLVSCELWGKPRSVSCTSQSSSSSLDLEKQQRRYVTQHAHSLCVYESAQHTVKAGEIFSVNIEVLKGRVFLTCVKLAFGPFAPTKTAACLYAVLTATNVLTGEQRTTRGTFLNTTDEASLEFSHPFVARESERIKMELVIKRAENICPFTIKRDVQIAMPDSKVVALKIIPNLPTSEMEDCGRCMFKTIEYFH